ncbi:hypothetical protein CROQUDRAFT_40948 [Cronartium quercuum f. sp. fusiforme G11]|uniref:C2H2-type domain-containing protein n=1 Tax=Cronartium quercuum f. sp. fusiforme G11 TaxID=708437 RepID=A0A9P6NR11_9BASI|nr:hypothetical protein CROQUDRAFT_40948 [Cronartium quercuum f. sp. fusiforme G11]
MRHKRVGSESQLNPTINEWVKDEEAIDQTNQFDQQLIFENLNSNDHSNNSNRERSYSHSSLSSVQSLSLASRTTPATKAAAAKRRKEGTEARYVCELCGETFTRRYNLRGHQRAHKGEKPFACGFPGCTSSFARAHDQKRHYKLHLGVKDYNCKACGKAFIRLDVSEFI